MKTSNKRSLFQGSCRFVSQSSTAVFPGLGEGFSYFHQRIRILHSKLCTLPAGKVWRSRSSPTYTEHLAFQSFQHIDAYAEQLMLVIFSLENFGAKQLGSNTFITGPGRCRKVEEVQKNHSVKFAGRNSVTLKKLR